MTMLTIVGSARISWGTGWGEAGGGQTGGWLRIAYNECGIDDKNVQDRTFYPADESATAMAFSKDALDGV